MYIYDSFIGDSQFVLKSMIHKIELRQKKCVNTAISFVSINAFVIF